MLCIFSYDANNGMIMTVDYENANESWCFVLNKYKIMDNLTIYTFWLAFMYIRSRSKQTKTVKTQDFL